MKPAPEDAALYAVRAASPLTAAEAVAWFAPGTPPGQQVIGHTFSARSATWIRVHNDGTIEAVSAAGDVLAEAYEMVLFDGERELRWLRTPNGRGPAVALGEDPTRLPSGHNSTATPPPRRWDTHIRLLDGVPERHTRHGWTTLDRSRYAAAHLPWTFTGGDLLVIEVVEYLVEDGHGNRDIADTRTVGLRATTREAVRAVTASTMIGQKETTA